MKAIINYIKGMLADGTGSPSSKRIIATLFAVLIAVAFIANLFYGLTIEDNLLDAAMLIVVAGLGITGMEKFAPKKKTEIE
jgi:hypothetical protein